MSDKMSAEERLEAFRRFKEEFQTFKSLLEAAFDELHAKALEKIQLPSAYVPVHSDFPKMSTTDSGFPIFFESGFYDKNAPKDYVGAIRPKGLLGYFSGTFDVPENGLPAADNLKEYLRAHNIGKKLQYTDYKGDTDFSDYSFNQAIGGAVEKYFHKHGLEAKIDTTARDRILWPVLRGMVQSTQQLTLMVPIALTHFDFDHYRLSETTYLTRIPKGLQLSRARMRAHGTGASQQVVHAATHAFVSNGWTLDVDSVGNVSSSLSSASEGALDAVNSFLGALRLATGIKTGYAQMLWVPRGWALKYYCDLPSLYGTTVRQYPSEFDSFGWNRECSEVTLEDMASVRRFFQQMDQCDSEAVRLAIKRLSSCLTRNDPSDAVLDGTIGLELLLGDDQNQSLSYKLRLRAAALSWLEEDAESATQIADKVKKIYASRSAIVHGKKQKRKKKAVNQDDDRGEQDRELAADLLRFVLRVLLANPEYLQPSRIDTELILRNTELADDNSKN